VTREQRKKMVIDAVKEMMEKDRLKLQNEPNGYQWKTIDTAPKDGREVLVFYKNEQGKGRIVKARYVGRFTVECDDDTYQVDYDENDIPYCPEGWYEQVDNYDDFAEFYMERNITHWMKLPSYPQGE